MKNAALADSLRVGDPADVVCALRYNPNTASWEEIPRRRTRGRGCGDSRPPFRNIEDFAFIPDGLRCDDAMPMSRASSARDPVMRSLRGISPVGDG